MKHIVHTIDVRIQCRDCFREMNKLTPWCTTAATYAGQVFYCPICDKYVKIVADTTDKSTVVRLCEALAAKIEQGNQRQQPLQRQVEIPGYARPTEQEIRESIDFGKTAEQHLRGGQPPDTTP